MQENVDVVPAFPLEIPKLFVIQIPELFVRFLSYLSLL